MTSTAVFHEFTFRCAASKPKLISILRQVREIPRLRVTVVTRGCPDGRVQAGREARQTARGNIQCALHEN